MYLNTNYIPDNTSIYLNNSQLLTIDNHLPFDFNDQTNLSFTSFTSVAETKSYTPITGCVLEYILTTTNLTNREKLYYLLADSLSLISRNRGGHRSCSLPSEDWAERLGCSRSLVFTMQQSLVKKGYFIISKDFDEIGRNKRNLITPTLPTSIFNHLNEKFSDRIGDHAPYNPLIECKRAYLDRTKLFIPLNYDLLKIITVSKYLNPLQKILWLGSYTRGYKNHMIQSKEDFDVEKNSYNNDSGFSFISSYRELADQYSCNTKHLSKSIRTLKELGFIKTQNIYIRKKGCTNDELLVQERQDQSLWKITLSLSESCILELEKEKDRSNLKLKDIKNELAAIESTVDPELIEDCLILRGIKFNLNLEQSNILKLLIDSDSDDNSEDIGCTGNIDSTQPLHAPCAESYIDSIIGELNADDTENIKGKLEESSRSENSDFLPETSKTLSASSTLETFGNNEEKSVGIKFDPNVVKSGLLLNKDLKTKIKNIKSNLGTSSKVLFDKFLKRLKDSSGIENKQYQKEQREFNIHSELIKEKLKELPKDKADKARKFAYSLTSKRLARGYAASLSKHELAKQLIHHAASWKPTKLGTVSREKEIDTALSVAWKAIVEGTWKTPLELAKAEILQWEFKHYKKKYRESGIISHELASLESAAGKLLKTGFIDLKSKIIRDVGVADISSNKEIIPEIITQNSSNHSIPLAYNKDIELPPFLEDQEYYLSYGYHNYSHTDSRIRGHNQSLITETDITYDEVTLNSSTGQLLDLSAISEKQKYLRMTCSEKNDEMVIKTVNNNEYLFKLKMMEVNGEGETVMTLKHVRLKSFVKEANNEFLNDRDNTVLDDLSYNYSTLSNFNILNQVLSQPIDAQVDTITKRDTKIEPKSLTVQIKQQPINGFIRQGECTTDIDTALSNILKNLQLKAE